VTEGARAVLKWDCIGTQDCDRSGAMGLDCGHMNGTRVGLWAQGSARVGLDAHGRC